MTDQRKKIAANLSANTYSAITDNVIESQPQNTRWQASVVSDYIHNFDTILAEGSITNYKIVITRIGTDLIILLRTFDGNVPSEVSYANATSTSTPLPVGNPIYARFSTDIYSVSTNLSASFTDGTNWFGLSNATNNNLKNQLFVYLFKTSTGFTLGLSRLPNLETYPDGTATQLGSTINTNNNYVHAIGATIGDTCINIGRIDVKLDNNNWITEPGQKVINKPIYRTDDLVAYTNFVIGGFSQRINITYSLHDQNIKYNIQSYLNVGANTGLVAIRELPFDYTQFCGGGAEITSNSNIGSGSWRFESANAIVFRNANFTNYGTNITGIAMNCLITNK